MFPRPLAALAACLLLAACGWARPPVAAVPPGDGDTGRTRAQSFLAVQSRVEPVAEAECRRLNPGSNCDFLILVDDRPGMPPNAYQTLDRRGRPILAVTTALIGEVRNPDELAFVLSHEASHHIAGHLARQDQIAAVGARVFGELASQEAGATAESVRRAQLIGAQVGARSFSKDFELEADSLGAVVAARAGFDPLVGAAFFLRIPDPGDRFLGTHPSNAERIAAVRQAVQGMGGR